MRLIYFEPYFFSKKNKKKCFFCLQDKISFIHLHSPKRGNTFKFFQIVKIIATLSADVAQLARAADL